MRRKVNFRSMMDHSVTTTESKQGGENISRAFAREIVRGPKVDDGHLNIQQFNYMIACAKKRQVLFLPQ